MPGFKFFILLLFVLTSPILYGQIPAHIFNEDTEESFNPKDFTSKNQLLRNRTGVYHFGDSEGEWDLVLLLNNDSLILQIWYANWAKDLYTKKETWLRKSRTFNNIRQSNNRFYFGKYSGQFVEFKQDNKFKNAILLYCDLPREKLYGKDSAEIGVYNTTIDIFFSEQKYSALSIKVQNDDYFANKTKQELKLMRNEISAKYGLIFQSGGEMEKYFTKQNWYHPFLKDVSNFLTSIEKKNVNTIIRFEQN